MHLKALSRYFEFVDLGNWLQRSQAGGELPSRACAITLDDGWSDNYRYAFPLLRQAKVPATIFLVSESIGSRYSFWPSRLARLLRRLGVGEMNALPTPLAEAIVSSGVFGKSGANLSVVDRIDQAIAACKVLPDALMQKLMDQAEASTYVGSANGERELLDADEIAEMRDSKLIQFGSHTMRHTRLLMEMPARVLRDEITQSQRQLEALLGQKIELFCYPNGNYTEEAVELVRMTYSGAVTTEAGWNSPTTDPYRLRRVTLHEGVSSKELSFLCRVGCLA